MQSHALPGVTNIFSDAARPDSGETFTDLLRCRNVRIERISSSDTPEPVLYDQEQDEWVVLLEGRATLKVDGDVLELGPGDQVFIPAHTPHSVIATQPDPRCLWLAVHIHPQDSSSSNLNARDGKT